MKRFAFPALLVAMSAWCAASHAAEGTVAELVADLGSQDTAVQIQAAEALEALGPEAADAVAALAEVLDSDSAQVQAHAAEALGAIGPAAKSAAEALAALVADDDAVVRREAVEALGAIKPGPAIMLPILAKLLQDPDPTVRDRIMHALADRGEDSLKLLVDALEDETTTYWACVVISEIGADAEEAVPALIKVLDCEKPGTCREAAMALAAIGPAAAPAVDKLLEMADCPVNGVPAIHALGSIGENSDAVRSKLIAKVRGEDPIAKTVAAWALAKLNPGHKRFVGRAVKLLVGTMQSDDADTRIAAAKALASLDALPDIVRPILLEAFDAADEETVRMMLDASASVGPVIVPRLVKALQHEELRSHVCYILGEIGPGAAPATAALAKLLDDDDVEVRKEAAFALAEIGPAAKEAVAALAEAVQVDDQVRFAAAYALGRIGADAEKAIPALVAQLEGDEGMALISAWALAHIHPECPSCQEKAIPVLIAGLGDTSPQFRREAAAGLCCFGPAAKDAVGPLKKALKDADEQVCEACEAALKAIDK